LEKPTQIKKSCSNLEPAGLDVFSANSISSHTNQGTKAMQGLSMAAGGLLGFVGTQ
jgi:hypothetical protein